MNRAKWIYKIVGCFLLGIASSVLYESGVLKAVYAQYRGDLLIVDAELGWVTVYKVCIALVCIFIGVLIYGVSRNAKWITKTTLWACLASFVGILNSLYKSGRWPITVELMDLFGSTYIIAAVLMLIGLFIFYSPHLLPLIWIERGLGPVGVLRKLVYLLALLSFVVLALTGFYPVLILGEHISGYLVMLHVTFAPVLTACVAVLAVMWASKCRFTAGDWPWFERIVQWVTSVKSVEKTAKTQSSGLGQKITFWLIIFLTLPLALTIVVSMFHFFGTHGQKYLLGLHRNIAYIFTVVVIVHTFLLVRSTAKK